MFGLMAMLVKEHGITVFGVCVIYDCLVIHKKLIWRLESKIFHSHLVNYWLVWYRAVVFVIMQRFSQGEESWMTIQTTAVLHTNYWLSVAKNDSLKFLV